VNALEAVAAALAELDGALAVSSLGTATSALRAASDDGPHLYMGGAMGAALSAALGVCDAASRRGDRRPVLAVLGDGELLMRPGALLAAPAFAPAELVVLVLADGRYAITGGQPLAAPPPFAAVAAAVPGLAARRAATTVEVAAAVRELARPCLVEALVERAEWPGPSPFVDPTWVRSRFLAAVRRPAP
jgi:thiamine pyrophosphate-dependent acetolactate synthase large subunit-like protein